MNKHIVKHTSSDDVNSGRGTCSPRPDTGSGTATDTTDKEKVLETRIAYRCFIPLSVRALSVFIFGALYPFQSGLPR